MIEFKFGIVTKTVTKTKTVPTIHLTDAVIDYVEFRMVANLIQGGQFELSSEDHSLKGKRKYFTLDNLDRIVVHSSPFKLKLDDINKSMFKYKRLTKVRGYVRNNYFYVTKIIND